MTESPPSNFIRTIIEEDLKSGQHQQVVTRFPPEPNGYLHIGHAKAICISFGLAEDFGGRYHLRMDDTNPDREDEEYVQAIERDIRWLGFDWGEHRYNASDYFEQLYAWAQHLIRGGFAYVDESSVEQIRAHRGTVESPGTPTPFRDRPVEESLARLEEMRRGDHPDGAMVLRARIDLASPNMQMRDPIMYRIRNTPHHRTGDAWHIYPMYDWAHGQSDAIEGITHSLCSLEFDNNRELYDWYLAHLPVENPPHQYEFAKLNLTYTVMGKRNLRAMVEEGLVSGWDDPRMPTLSGMRRRGVPPEAIRAFIEAVGVSKANSTVDPLLLENAIRDELNHRAPRVMAVLDPLEVVIEGWDQGTDRLEASYWPHDVPREGSREVPFSGRVFIEASDFEADPPRGFKRLAPGRTVRLRYAYVVTYAGHEVDDTGRVIRVRVRLEPGSRGGTAPEGLKVWSTLHWVCAEQSVPIEVRLYDRLFSVPAPGSERDFREDLNADSLSVITARAEPSLARAEPGQHFQLERTGYFFVEPDSAPGAPVLNRVVSLKDTWARRAAPQQPSRASKPRPKQATAAPVELSAEARALVERGLSSSEASTLAGDPALMRLFDAAVAVHDNPKGAAGWIVTELAREAKERALESLPIEGGGIGALVALIDEGTITHTIGKVVFQEMIANGGDPGAIVEVQGLKPITTAEALQPTVDEVLSEFGERVAAYKGGRKGLFGFFIGQVMSRTGGRANPQLVRELLTRALD